jgi:hypothetical protein
VRLLVNSFPDVSKEPYVIYQDRILDYSAVPSWTVVNICSLPVEKYNSCCLLPVFVFAVRFRLWGCPCFPRRCEQPLDQITAHIFLPRPSTSRPDLDAVTNFVFKKQFASKEGRKMLQFRGRRFEDKRKLF